MTGKPDSLTLPVPLAAPHLAGILGDGQSALAALLRHDGATVSGCDIGGQRGSEKQGTLSGHLAQLGIPVSAGHDLAHLPAGMTALVYSAAIPAGHAELDAARRTPSPGRKPQPPRAGCSRLRRRSETRPSRSPRLGSRPGYRPAPGRNGPFFA